MADVKLQTSLDAVKVVADLNLHPVRIEHLGRGALDALALLQLLRAAVSVDDWLPVNPELDGLDHVGAPVDKRHVAEPHWRIVLEPRPRLDQPLHALGHEALLHLVRQGVQAPHHLAQLVAFLLKLSDASVPAPERRVALVNLTLAAGDAPLRVGARDRLAETGLVPVELAPDALGVGGPHAEVADIEQVARLAQDAIELVPL